MNQKEIKKLKFHLMLVILGLMIIIGFLSLESKVQKRWDNYEQKVFAEYHINGLIE